MFTPSNPDTVDPIDIFIFGWIPTIILGISIPAGSVIGILYLFKVI